MKLMIIEWSIEAMPLRLLKGDRIVDTPGRNSCVSSSRVEQVEDGESYTEEVVGRVRSCLTTKHVSL